MALTTAFARNGNKKIVPQTTADGSVSYDQGFGNLYALPPEEGGLFIDRAQFNQIMFDTTSAVISNQNSITTLNSKVANIESSVSTGVVNLTGNQTISGVKTFSSPPVSATNPTANNQVANKAYVDSVGNTAVKLTGNQTIAGTKTFSSPVVVPDATANNHAVNLSMLNTKANWNSVVNLTGNQSIAGAKTFTSNITAPNITAMQTQINNIAGGGKFPMIMQGTALNITAGTGGDFTKLTEALTYAKQTQSKRISDVTKITLLSDFNDDLFINGYPLVYIDCNGFKLANKFTANHSRVLLNKLKLGGILDTVSCFVQLFSGANIGGVASGALGAGSSIVSNSSTIVIGGNVTFSPNENQYGIYSKGASTVYILGGSTFTQNAGAYFLCVGSGGKICLDANVNTSGVSVTKTNITLNTLTSNGMILGNI